MCDLMCLEQFTQPVRKISLQLTLCSSPPFLPPPSHLQILWPELED